MRIVFFGQQSTIDFHQIGGVESFIRRLAMQLVKEGDAVDYVMFGCQETKVVTMEDGKLRLLYFKSFLRALKALFESYDYVITTYLHFVKRLEFLLFRFIYHKKLKFCVILLGLPESALKRWMIFFDAKLFYEKVLVISPRLFKAARRWSLDPVLLLPPVPEDYFLRLDEKPRRKKIRLTYIGRIDVRKGIEDAIELFLKLRDHENIETQIYGYYSDFGPNSQNIYKWLKEQSQIKFVDVEQNSYTPQLEQQIRLALKDTDVLVLPYRSIDGTIDIPLLLLEGMASLCAIITTTCGDIPFIYGKSKLLLDETSDLKHIINILSAPSRLYAERIRILTRNKELKFGAKDISRLFRESLKGVK